MKKWVIISIIVGVIVLGVAWILISPLFIDNVVDEEFPLDLELGDSSETTAEIQESEVMPDGTQTPGLMLKGNFIDADDFHKASGNVMVVTSGEQKFLRFEDFSTTNGPDLKIYLATDKDATEFVDLGKLKGNIGNQNYEIPEGTDLEKYNQVLIWCRAFSTLFGSAELN